MIALSDGEVQFREDAASSRVLEREESQEGEDEAAEQHGESGCDGDLHDSDNRIGRGLCEELERGQMIIGSYIFCNVTLYCSEIGVRWRAGREELELKR